MRYWSALLMSHCSLLLAAEPIDRDLAPMGMQSLLQTGGGMLLILLLIFTGAWLFKRYGQLPVLGKGLIRILGGVSVGPRERVVILEVDNTRLVVGVAPGQIRTLHVLGSAASEVGFEDQLALAKQTATGGAEA